MLIVSLGLSRYLYSNMALAGLKDCHGKECLQMHVWKLSSNKFKVLGFTLELLFND